MLEEHRKELVALENDIKKFDLSLDSLACIEGRISDLKSMIAQDEYWEKMEKHNAKNL